MKKLLLVLALVPLLGFSQVESISNKTLDDTLTKLIKNPFAEECDPAFVLDYRTLYNDTITPVDEFIETIITDRFGFRTYSLDVTELYDTITPKYQIVEVQHPFIDTWIILANLCSLEKYAVQADFTSKILTQMDIEN